MKVLVTAGGMAAPIDSVRSIVNRSTGRLGSIIADTFAKNGARVSYVCSTYAEKPVCDNIEVVHVHDMQELCAVICRLFCAQKFDCIIHSMAVADYLPSATLTVHGIVQHVLRAIERGFVGDMTEEIRQAVLSAATPLPHGKIGSKHEQLMLLFSPAPKIISTMKAQQPQAILVGFKLLVDVPEEQLIRAGLDLLMEHKCDFVVANDLRGISAAMHHAILLQKNGIVQKACTKQEIANAIYVAVKELQ